MKQYQAHTAAQAIKQIEKGDDTPWVAYGNFLEDWHFNVADKLALVALGPKPTTPEGRRWTSLLAASIEFLCTRESLIAPAWISDPRWNLAEPWCLYEDASPKLAQWAKEVSAPEFLRRNIWTSPSVVERT